jgi:hypothetical protein
MRILVNVIMNEGSGFGGTVLFGDYGDPRIMWGMAKETQRARVEKRLKRSFY